MTPQDMLRQAVAEAVAAQQLPAVRHDSAPVPCGCQHGHQAPPTVVYAVPPAPAVRRSLARPLAVGGAAVVGGVAVLGTVTALLLAVAITAVSVAISAAVLVFLVRTIRKAR